LINAVSLGDVELLYQRLLENAEGPLKEYLEKLDMEAEGIETPEDLIQHLREAGAANGFSMDDVRKAMMKSLDQPLEVDRIYDALLKSAKDPVKEILEDLNLRKEGISTVEELIATLYRELEARGYSRREIEKMLTDLFESHADYIKELGKKATGAKRSSRDDSRVNRKGWPIAIILGLAGGFLLLILWWRRRRKNEKSRQ
jgi:lipoate-protein ligase A